MSYMTEANAIAAALRGQGSVRRQKAAVATGLQLQVLEYMRTFLAENDQLPPMHLIALHFDIAASSADWHVKTLLRLGFLERNAAGKLRFARGGAAC
jgi:hypothetical protein